jgi:hypothetical protein
MAFYRLQYIKLIEFYKAQKYLQNFETYQAFCNLFSTAQDSAMLVVQGTPALIAVACTSHEITLNKGMHSEMHR